MADRVRESALVIDDERGPRDSLRMLLSPSFQVRTAADAREALGVLRREDVALATLDLDMPGMRGVDLLRRMREGFPRTEIIVITGCGSVSSAAEAVRAGACDYLEKPFDVVQVGAAAERALQRRRAGRGPDAGAWHPGFGGGVESDPTPSAILRSLERVGRRRGARPDTEREERRTFHFLEVLAETIETKDRYMSGHGRRVSFYAALLAEHVGLSGRDRERVHMGAFLHDLGKVGVPAELLLREGALDARERRIIEQHPEIGARLVQPLGLPSDLVHAIRHHHEWWDGTGYPDGLAGEEIPYAARVVAIADSFDAMTSDRPYRTALPRDVALAEIVRFAGIQFDPALARAFTVLLASPADDVARALSMEAPAGPPAEAAASTRI